MNFPVLTAILKSELPCAQKMILTVLLNHAGADGRAWPSQTTIAYQAGLCERAVRGHIKALTGTWLTRSGHQYTIVIPAESAASDAEIRQNLPDLQADNRQEMPVEPAKSAAQPAANAAQPAKSAAKPPNNHPKNQSRTNHPEAGVKPSKPDWREFNRTLATRANAVQTPLLAPPEFREAWQRYQSYRTNRACEARISSEALLWTEDAASAAIRGCERAADAQGWPAVCHRIDEAIAGRWQGLNLDKAQQPRSNGYHSQHQPRHPAYTKERATAGLTPEQIGTF